MRTALISSEMVPFAKSGGLADAVAGLARAAADAGVEVVVLLPLYRSTGGDGLRAVDVDLYVDVAGRRLRVGVWQTGPTAGLTAYLVDIPELFDRPGLYGDAEGIYTDNLMRFSVFCRASIKILRALRVRCDVLHAHDWQAALVPFLLKTEVSGDGFFAGARSILTIHNLAYQGLFPAGQFPLTGLDRRYFDVRYVEFHGGVNLLKAGLVSADAITTVSPTYAREVLQPALGAGLDGVLRDRRQEFVGILNGIDARLWDPATDLHLACRYRAGALPGKGKCKLSLLDEVGLPRSPDAPLIGVVSRLVTQKGIDLLVRAIPRLAASNIRWVVLGTGDAEIANGLRALAAAYPRSVAVLIDFDEGLAHRIQAGADYLAMPSRFEPCGLSQLYALRYGTIPIVSNVGGLADTVVDVDDDPDRSTGVVLAEVSVEGVIDAVKRARALYRKPHIWASLRRRAIESDFSWPRSAARYIDLYRRVLAAPSPPIPPGPGASTGAQ